MYIILSFLNGTESAQIKESANSDAERTISGLPIGTFLTEILNADINDIASRIANCEAAPPTGPGIFRPRIAPGNMFCNWEKLPGELDLLQKDYPNIFSLFSSNLYKTWHDTTFEFCVADPHNGNLRLVNEIATFKLFLDELMESPELFTFDFLEYLNVIGAIKPYSTLPCSVHSDHHKTGESFAENTPLKELYSVFINGKALSSKEYRYEFPFFSLAYIMICSFLETVRHGKTVRKCRNCGKYFIPAKRSDTLYCDNPSPEAPEMTCKEYGNQRLWYERQKEDELATLSRKIASAKGMLAKRNPDIPQYADSYKYFKEQRLIWIKAVKEGTKTQDEYREWLLYMQGQKRIKEAAHGNG